MDTESRFWEMRMPESLDEKFRAEWTEEVHLEHVVCPVNAKHRRAGKRITNLSVVLHSSEVFDVMWTWGNECLIQQHVFEALKRHSFSGFQVKPAEARFERADASSPPRLWELVVTGWSGVAPPESGIRIDAAKSCTSCGHIKYTSPTDYSHLIDETKWDGSDFFMVWPMPKHIFVTNRVREFMQGMKYRAVAFVEPKNLKPKSALLSDIGFSPGKLSYWMPDDRARELGEPLGIY